MSNYELRLLDPVTEQELFHTAYNWRRPKRHTQPDRMPFEDFAAVSDTQLTIGLFNGELQAVYFLQEVEPSVYQAHFTTHRGLDREIALLGAQETARLLLQNGASQIDAWITERNQPLRQFLLSLGFKQEKLQEFSNRLFVKYILRKLESC